MRGEWAATRCPWTTTRQTPLPGMKLLSPGMDKRPLAMVLTLFRTRATTWQWLVMCPDCGRSLGHE